MHNRDGIVAPCATKYDLKKEEVGQRERKCGFFGIRGNQGRRKKSWLDFDMLLEVRI
jgi:hypothetical protein